MKVLLIIGLLLAGCAATPIPIKPMFPACPDLVPTPAKIGKKETIAAFEVRIELSREESVKAHAACLKTVAKMAEYIAQHN